MVDEGGGGRGRIWEGGIGIWRGTVRSLTDGTDVFDVTIPARRQLLLSLSSSPGGIELHSRRTVFAQKVGLLQLRRLVCRMWCGIPPALQPPRVMQWTRRSLAASQEGRRDFSQCHSGQ